MRLIVGAFALLLWPATASAQGVPGRTEFEQFCARCHGGDGRGGQMGPAIVGRLQARSDADLATLVREGLPQRGMPGVALPAPDVRRLIAFLRTLGADAAVAVERIRVELVDGGTLAGVAMNRSSSDLQLLADDGRLHLLRVSDTRYREVTSETGWPGYHGHPSGNRFSELRQIDVTNVARLRPAWMFTLAGAERLQVTPVVADGVMYVTNANECYALDAGSGRRIWHYRRPRTKGLAGDAAGGINRGVALGGDRVFMVTDDARLLALNRFTGALLWETVMADWRRNYGATSAPLVVGRLVISGVSGGDEGVRGFLAAFDRDTGRQVWRFWTVPAPGEAGAETWRGTDIAHGCATTWLTGTYDPALDTLYWPTGNPCPDYDGRQRLGDNLYSDSILALDPATGRLKWHFQYTPHDVWDWDAQQPAVLVDAMWGGAMRRLLLHANRNGFFYVLDRASGALLQATPFVKKLTWARRIGPDGRPVLNPDQIPHGDGLTVCPAVDGATNWFSTAFSPVTGLYYVQALEKCTVYTRSASTWRPGRSFYSGTTRNVPGEIAQKVLRALDLQTGAVRWEVPQAGEGSSWGGTLATSGGLVFYADDSGALAAVDASSGAPLWRFQTNALWKASPMTYVFDGRQHVAIAAGSSILAFKLVE